MSADAANYNIYITVAFYFLPLIIRIINLHSPTIIQLEPVHSLEAVMFLYLSRAVVAQFSSLPSPSPSPSRSQAQAGGGTIAILSQPRHDRDGGHLPAFISFHFAPSPVRASKPIQDEFPADDDDDNTLTISDKPVIPESVISLITRHQYQGWVCGGNQASVITIMLQITSVFPSLTVHTRANCRGE